MSDDVDWVTSLISKVRKDHASVTDVVLDRVVKLLKEQASERSLPQAQLKGIAKELIEGMKLASSEAEAKQ